MGRPQINVTTRLINCPEIVPDSLRAGPEATQAPTPLEALVGQWINFAQLTEAGRLQENRDKRTLDELYRRCAAENTRINQPVRRRRLFGIF